MNVPTDMFPDLMDFMNYSIYNGDYKHKYLGTKWTTSATAHIGVDAIRTLRKPAIDALRASRRFEAPIPIEEIAELAKPFLSLGNQYGEGWFLTGEMAELLTTGTPNIVCIQPFACLPNHVVGKGVIKALRKEYPQANIAAVDYDPGASEVNQLNRIKLMLSQAKRPVRHSTLKHRNGNRMIDKNLKSTLAAVAFGVILFAVLMNMETVIFFLGHIVDLIFPVMLGLLIAFVLNVPVNGIENLIRKLFEKCKHRPGGKVLRLFSLLVTLLCIALILILLFTSVIPEIIRTSKSIAVLVEEHWPEWIAALKSMNMDTAPLEEWLNSFDLHRMIDTTAKSAWTLLGSVANVATTTVAGVAQLLIGLVLAIYMLMDLEKLSRQCKKFLYANVKVSLADKICEIAGLVRWSYTKYLSGQCIEALILGVLILIAFLIAGLPYAGLVAMVTAICALIPYIGATISCIVAVLLTLLTVPKKALLCLLVYLVVQFIENQFIYPHVVGESVGLTPLWTLIAVLVGGRVCGFIGVVFFIPLTAVLYILIRDDVNRKLLKKGYLLDDSCN